MENLKIKRKVYEIILGEMGNFIRLDEIIKPVSTKILNIGGYNITLYYVKENEDKDGNITWRMLYRDQLLFSDIVENNDTY